MTMDQFLGLYNYWIVIFLMMTGFYIVIARENLIKSIIGLNIFQTSVFLLYITMGKVNGGTAPIIKNGNGDGHHGEDHVPVEAVDHVSATAAEVIHLSGHGEAVSLSGGVPTTKTSNEVLDELLDVVDGVSQVQPASFLENAADASSLPLENLADGTATQGALDQGAHLVAEYQGVIYSNPLPSVLMLTAIVVGIATTALALALIVRIREDYGTIEEDEIIELDRNS